MTRLRTLMQNQLELIGGLAAVVVCIALIWGAADEQGYTIENGKWLQVERGK